MSDSDETVGPDSDDTLPPDDLDDRCCTPDLFDDEPRVNRNTYKKPMSGTTSLKKQCSNTHDMSESGSDSETQLFSRVTSNKIRTPDHHANKDCKDDHTANGVNSLDNQRKVKNGNDMVNNKRTPERARSNKSTPEKARSPLVSNTKKSNGPDRGKKTFMDDFLNMTDSDSDNEYEENRKKLLAMKEQAVKQRSKLSKHNSDVNKEGASVKVDKSKSPNDSKHVDKHHFSQKQHKKDYSAPFHKSDSSSHKSPNIKADIKKNDLHEKSNSPMSSLKRKHSKSPVPHELRKVVTDILYPDTNCSTKKKQPCQYGVKCYRKNPSHLEEFSHPHDPGDGKLTPTYKKAKLEKVRSESTLTTNNRSESLLSTKVRPESPSTSKVRSESPSTSKIRSAVPSTSKIRSVVPSTSKIISVSPSNSKVKTHSLTSDCKIVKRSRSPCANLKTVQGKMLLAQPYSFFLTKVAGISDEHNSTYAMDIKDILSEEMGSLTASCQFNFMFDIQWLMKQYPPHARSKPLLIVHGEHGSSMAALQAQAMSNTNIRFCQAKLEMIYGTHHTKMMLLLYDDGLRVVIHTSNLIQHDWHQKTQGMWVSPLFPRLLEASKDKSDSSTYFKRDLIEYLQAYKAYQLKDWIDHLTKHDMSAARVVIIGSTPGRHIGEKTRSMWGHLKLRRVLQEHGPTQEKVKAWPVVGQFSSIGSMGPSKDNWLCGEWQQSLSATKSGVGLQSNTRLQLIFPSRHNVRLSLEGYPAGGSIPYTTKTAKKQPFLHDFFHVWKSEGRGRSSAMPHIKTYARPMQDGSKAAWFLVTSANLSKAAWGALEKKGAQLMIRSYEMGVLFLPKFFDEGEIFPITSDPESAATTNKFLIPYDLPPTIYDKKDRPWMWDIPYMDLPDTNGNVWCPFSK